METDVVTIGLAAVATAATVLLGMWRMFAHYDNKSERAHRDIGQKIDGVRAELGQRIDTARDQLTARIDRVYENLTARRGDP